MNHFEKRFMKWRTLILLILCTPQSKGYLGSDSVCQVKWQNEFCVYRHHALRNVVLQSHLRRLPWRRIPINIKTHFYFTRAHSNSPGYPLDWEVHIPKFLVSANHKTFFKIVQAFKRHMSIRMRAFAYMKTKIFLQSEGVTGFMDWGCLS